MILQPKAPLPVVERIEEVLELCVSKSDGREDVRGGSDDAWWLQHAERSEKTEEEVERGYEEG